MQGHRNVPPGWFRMVHQTRSSDPTKVPMVHVEGVASAEETILHAESSDVDNTNISLDTAANDDDVSSLVSLTVSNLTALNASWIDKLTKRPGIFLEPFEKLIEANQKMNKSDSSLTSSLTVFGREQACAANKPLSVKHFKKSTIPVQPTARGRRTVHLEGKQAQRGGRPSNAMFHFSGGGDHNSYATTSTSKRKSNEPHWASLPNKRNMPAPHALMACVNANRMLGGNHSKK
ncbi:GTP 3',8-cyclase [Frankliniella fusca]|uniref:GTP 3',8-cyclase n=1 Tax=Frankliniella fusca TaxID=407009 RepID=A0AAE1H8C4_9NEOP|nr:GTP 3',8-cyclase [Frankliniella fusca]